MRLRFTKGKWRRYSGYENIKKATSDRSKRLLEKLNGFMDENSPQAARFVANLFENQRNAITYREIREAIISGDIDMATLRAWQEDYSRFVEQHLKPMWTEAMKAHARLLEEQHNGFFYDPVQERAQNWIDRNGARWVTNQTEETQKAVRSMLGYATTGGFSPDELSRVIRPAIGLNAIQAKASVKYYRRVRDKLLKNNPNMRLETAQKKAREAQLKYNARQHRYRADTIAQTELAYAYNRGMDEAVWQAQVQGYMGAVVKRWLTARNAEVCDMCQDLDGAIIEMEQKFDIKLKELFPGAHETPPAHARCRCVVEYLELTSPELAEYREQLKLRRGTRQSVSFSFVRKE